MRFAFLFALVAAACTSVGGLSGGADDPTPDASTNDAGNGVVDAAGGSDDADDAAPNVLGAAYRAVVMEDKPLAYYRFEDGDGAKIAKDDTGAHDGAYPIDPTFVSDGIAGSHAMRIKNGSLSHVRVPGAPFAFPDVAPMAVEAWVRPSTYVDYEMLVSNEPSVTPRRGWSLFLRAPGRVELDWFQGPPDSGSLDVLAKFAATFVVDGGAPPLGTGAWIHVVYDFDAGSHLYVNGKLAHYESSVTPTAPPGNDLFIGCRATTSGVRDCLSDGDLDEVAIYDHALGEIRAKVHYEKGKP